MKLFNLNNLEVFHAKKIPTHGGSIRVYASRKGIFKKTKSFKKIIEQEKESEINKLQTFKIFKKKVIESKYKLLTMLIELRKKKKKIFAVGAPSRASTLINYIGIDKDLVECILEVSSSNKLNKYLPGTLIPVVDEKIIQKSVPDYLLILSWHIKDELIKVLKKNLKVNLSFLYQHQKSLINNFFNYL